MASALPWQMGVENPQVRENTNSAVPNPRLGRSVSIEQAMALLGVSRRTVYYRIREGRLQTIRTLGGSQRVLVESIHSLARSSPSCSTGNAPAALSQRTS